MTPIELVLIEYGLYDGPPLGSDAKWRSFICPFHADNSPSFGVNPGINCFNCLSCPAKGGVLQLVIDAEKLVNDKEVTKAEAFKRLEEITGIEGDDLYAAIEGGTRGPRVPARGKRTQRRNYTPVRPRLDRKSTRLNSSHVK